MNIPPTTTPPGPREDPRQPRCHPGQASSGSGASGREGRVSGTPCPLSPELSGDALPVSKRGLVFTAVTVVTTVPQGITVRSVSTLAVGAGGGVCQDFASVGST